MADAAYEEARRVALAAVLRCQKLALVRAILARHAAGATIVELCDVAQDVLDATHLTFNDELARVTRLILDGQAPERLQ